MFKFRPPSVVISILFSGTKQTKFGLFFKAIFNIDPFAAISKFNGIFLLFAILYKSLSLICRLSSLKCIVTESAPNSITFLAAKNGFGNRIAHVYFELKQINQDAEMVAFVDPQPIGKKFAESKNIFPVKEYKSLSEMLKSQKLDLLMVGSPNHLHLEHIKLGLEFGVKIFAEKPIVTDEKQTWKLAKLIKEFGKENILVGLVLRYSQQARAVRDLIANKNLGKII